jgi:hypothetical protein
LAKKLSVVLNTQRIVFKIQHKFSTKAVDNLGLDKGVGYCRCVVLLVWGKNRRALIQFADLKSD